ncbi:MAG: metalloregulator ArsR/SmtB family transcription factor [Desulfobulbaceae bacterium]|jgi:ArsR family transcriptional regulator|nr:metalloregulator ArsR/SmtB family transcription factor [Desulfobulbaceae bacterium]
MRFLQFAFWGVVMRDDQAEAIAKYLGSMSHPIRLKILYQLLQGERTVGELRDRVATTGANLSQHLRVLRELGVVVSDKKANAVHNRIADKRFVELLHKMRRLFCPDEE